MRRYPESSDGLEPSPSCPIFFVGAPRSGTTVIFEAFVRHERLGTRTSLHSRFPEYPQVGLLLRLIDNRFIKRLGHKEQYGDHSLLDRILPQPVEDYNFWDNFTDVNFSRSFLLGVCAAPEVRQRVQNAVTEMLRWQGKGRLAWKLTGPPRVGFLNSIFPSAVFVHVIRDARAVVDSLLRVRWWREQGGLAQPWWTGGLSRSEMEEWRSEDRDPALLAALQWRKIIRAGWTERSLVDDERYVEVRYEDFVEAPSSELKRLYDFCDLPFSSTELSEMERSTEFWNMNYKYRDNLHRRQIALITEATSGELLRLGYTLES